MSYKAVCLTRNDGTPYLLSYHFSCREQTVVQWTEACMQSLAEAQGRCGSNEDRGETPEAVTWIDDDTLGLFKTIQGPGEDFYLMAFLSSHKTTQALEFLEKLHFYIQAIMKYPMGSNKTIYRQIELEMSMQDLFSKRRFLPRKTFADKTLFCSGLEKTLCSLFGFCSTQDPMSLQKINKPRQNWSMKTVNFDSSSNQQQGKYSYLVPSAEMAVEERKEIQSIGRTLAAECRIGFKKEREEVLEAVYVKVLGELAKPNDQADTNDPWNTRITSNRPVDPENQGIDSNFNGIENGLTVNKPEELQEDEEFFKGMSEGMNIDFWNGDNNGFQFNMDFNDTQNGEPQNITVEELPKHGDFGGGNFFSFPEYEQNTKKVLENNLSQQQVSIPFDRTENNSPNRSARQSYGRKQEIAGFETFVPNPDQRDTRQPNPSSAARNDHHHSAHHPSQPLDQFGKFNPFSSDESTKGHEEIVTIQGPRESGNEATGFEGWAGWKKGDKKPAVKKANIEQESINQQIKSQIPIFPREREPEHVVLPKSQHPTPQEHQEDSTSFNDFNKYGNPLPQPAPINLMAQNKHLLPNLDLTSDLDDGPAIPPVQLNFSYGSAQQPPRNTNAPTSTSEQHISPQTTSTFDGKEFYTKGVEAKGGSQFPLVHPTVDKFGRASNHQPYGDNSFIPPPPEPPKTDDNYIIHNHKKKTLEIFSPSDGRHEQQPKLDFTPLHEPHLINPSMRPSIPVIGPGAPIVVPSDRSKNNFGIHPHPTNEVFDIGKPRETPDAGDNDFNFKNKQPTKNNIAVPSDDDKFFENFDHTKFFADEIPQNKPLVKEPAKTIPSQVSQPYGQVQQTSIPTPFQPTQPIIQPQQPIFEQSRQPPEQVVRPQESVIQKPQIIKSQPVGNIDLLGLDITPTNTSVQLPMLATTSPTSKTNPFEDDSSPISSPNVPSPTEVSPQPVPQPPPVAQPLPIEPPSLNNYHLIQHDKILHRESVAQNKSTSELLGRLTLTVHSPQPTQTTQPPPSALGATVRIGLVGDYWLREGLAKRIPPNDQNGIVEDLPSAVEVNLQGRTGRCFQEYVIKPPLLKIQKLPCLMKHQLQEKTLKVKVYTNSMYAAYSLGGAKLTVRISKPLNKFQFESSNPSFTIQGRDICYPLDTIKYGERFDLVFQILEFAVTFEAAEVTLSLPTVLEDKLEVRVETASHLGPGASREFNYLKHYHRSLEYKCALTFN